jgi:hypothetical protein
MSLPKPMSAREWAAYKTRQRQREQQQARVLMGRFSPEERAAMLAEALRNSRKGWATSFPAVGITAVRKSKWKNP